MKKRAIIFVTAIVLIIAITAIFVSCNTKKYDTSQKSGDLVKETSLTVNSDGTFKVMQISDMHLTTGGTYKPDNESLRWLEEALDIAKPDLVEMTGDIVGSGVKGRNAGILAVANIFEKKQIYWAYTFGNHDGEHSTDANGKDLWIGKEGDKTDLTKACANVSETINTDKYEIFYGDNTKGNKELYELLKGYKYSLLTRSEEEQVAENEAYMGVGNYVIDVKNQSGDVVYALFHMDTHGKFYVNELGNNDPGNYIDGGYVGLTDMQVNWYKNKIRSYSDRKIATALFMHVPNFGYREVYEVNRGFNRYGVPQFAEKADIQYWSTQNKLSENNEINSNYFAYQPPQYNNMEFIKQEDIYAPRWDDGLMNVIADYPSTMMISVGHDHNNSFANIVNMQDNSNIMLAYGRTSGVNAWSRDIPIGASVYSIRTGIYFNAIDTVGVSVIFPNFKYTKYGNR